MSILIYILGWVMAITGIVMIATSEYNEGYSEGVDDYKYVSNDATYSTMIGGEKVEYSYGKINELIKQDKLSNPKIIFHHPEETNPSAP